MKLWLYQQWIGDHKDDAELAKNHAYLLASFSNPEAVQKIMNDGNNTHQSNDEEFEESLNMVRNSSLEMVKKEEENQSKKKRKVLKK